MKKKPSNDILPYFCTCCRVGISHINQAFVLDEKSSKYFCSEKCILEFHQGHIEHFQQQEKTWRKESKSSSEKVYLTEKEQQHWMEQALKQPDEMWIVEDALSMEYFCLIKRCGISIDSTYLVVICHLFNLRPSFVFHHIFTKDLKLVEKYRWGKSYSEQDFALKNKRQHQSAGSSKENEFSEEVVLSKELMQEIELIRSQLLSELILMRSDNDIPLEGFSAYEKYMEKTIDKPTESFEYKTKDGQLLLVNISDQQEKSKTLYYFVVSMKLNAEAMAKHTHRIDQAMLDQRPMLIPVLAFPSVDFHVYQYYKRGHCINKRSLN